MLRYCFCFMFAFWPQSMWDLRFLTRDLNLHALRWRRWSLTLRPPGSYISFFFCLVSLIFPLSFAPPLFHLRFFLHLRARVCLLLCLLSDSLYRLCVCVRLCTKWEAARSLEFLLFTQIREHWSRPICSSISQDFPFLIIWLCKHIWSTEKELWISLGLCIGQAGMRFFFRL